MRTIRICLLVLLAALLPIRGAVAAAMLCPPTSAGHQSSWSADAVVAVTGHHAMDDAGHGEGGHVDHQHADHHHADHHEGMSGSGAHHGDGPGKCNLCCDFCSLTPLLSTPPSVAVPLNLSAVSFPDFPAPAPSFLSDGQERPPRSI